MDVLWQLFLIEQLSHVSLLITQVHAFWAVTWFCYVWYQIEAIIKYKGYTTIYNINVAEMVCSSFTHITHSTHFRLQKYVSIILAFGSHFITIKWIYCTFEYNPWTMKILLVRSVKPTCFTHFTHSYHFLLGKQTEHDLLALLLQRQNTIWGECPDIWIIS